MLAGILLNIAGASVPAAAQGPTVITVAGKISETNRGPLDAFEDAFLNSHDIAFDAAFTFDREALAALGMHRLVTRIPGTDHTVNVEGPLLRDVLKKVGASGKTVSVMALDGYAADIAVANLDTWPVVLALKNNGKWLDIGGRGPAWVVYPANEFPALATKDDAGWVWAAFFMRID